MAGRLLTKGVAWKKAAVTLLAEGNHPGSVPTFGHEDRFVNSHQSLYASPFITQTGVKCRFGGNSLDSNKCFTTAAKFPPIFPSKKYPVLSSLVRHSSFAPAHKIRGDLSRCYSTSSANSASSAAGSPKTVSPKVEIISSMFTEEAKLQQGEKKVHEKEGKKKEEEKNEEKTENPFLRSQRIAKWMLIGTFAIGTPLFIYESGPPERDEKGNAILDKFSNDPAPIAYVKRAWNEINSMKKDIVEPSSQKLLPDPMQPPYYQPPYTLVIELFDVLLHPVYDQIHGWRFKKRPGIDYFLEQVGPPLYEIVIFTRETGMTAFTLIDSMDPKGYIMYRLFRDAARFKSGLQMGNIMKGEWPKLDPYYQKDLKYLNRDLRRVIVVDNDKRATELQPSNGISLKPWNGSSTDTELFDLAAFLRTVASNEVDDVRPVLEHYRRYEDPLAAFKLAQVRIHEEQLKLAKEMQENKGRSFLLNSKGGGSGFSMLTNYFIPRK